MSTHGASTTVNTQFIRSHLVPLAKLPEPGEPFSYNDAPDGVTFRSLKSQGIIRCVGRERRVYEAKDNTNRRDVKLWEVTTQAHQEIQKYLDVDREYANGLPCSDEAPHTGITNTGDGEYECMNCGAVHDRDTVEAVFGGGD